VLIPLISYAVLATIAVVILYFRSPPEDPLQRLPDTEGQFKGARHDKPKALSYERQRVDPDTELPASLRVPLGQTIRVGDLEVTPQEVELRQVTIRQPGFAPEPASDNSLVLHLLLRNVSQDVVFCPTDPCFVRRWKPGAANSSRPYTFIEMGKRRFYGGPLFWKPGQPDDGRETIEGEQYRELKPGEIMATVICSDPEDHLGDFLEIYHGALLWRVQLRRGLVSVRGREVSATAVIGVRFTDREVVRG
jgi:hypothetical protein